MTAARLETLWTTTSKSASDDRTGAQCGAVDDRGRDADHDPVAVRPPMRSMTMLHRSLGVLTVDGGAYGTCGCGFTTGLQSSIMAAHEILSDHLIVSNTDGKENE